MDHEEEAAEKCHWMLHQKAVNGPECALAAKYEQRGAAWEPPKNK